MLCVISCMMPAGPEYVPLLQRSYSLFQSLENEAGQVLFKKTGER